jgi:hypothetical protein
VGLATIYLAVLLFMIFKLNKKAKSAQKQDIEAKDA